MQTGRRDQLAPVLADKTAGYRDAAVTQDEMVPAREPGEHAETIIRQPVPVQIADEPAAARVSLHPPDELHVLRVGQMVRELRADDEVEAFRRIDREYVAGAEPDWSRGRLACGAR